MHVLRHVPFLAGLPGSDLDRVDERCVAHGYHGGSTIYQAGMPAGSMFVPASGRIKLTRARAGTSDVVVDVVLPGGLFGALPSPRQVAYEETAEALTVSCALGITRADFDQIPQHHPRVARGVISTLAENLAEARRSIQRRSGESVAARLAATLLALAARAGQDQRDTTLLQIPLTRPDLAP